MSLFTVTRQKRWIDGMQIVEVNQGSLDYANPDMLVPKYQRQGEGDTFVGMLPAIEAAIKIAELWKKESKPIYIGVGNTHGMTAQFAEMKLTSKKLKQLREEAIAYDAKLPKCCRCGDILGKDTFTLVDCDDEFCSENCAERAYESMQEDHDEEIQCSS